MSSQRLQKPIENPTLELKLVSASNVSHIDATDKIDIYAVVSVNANNIQKKQAAKTPIDFDGGSNPTWNHTVKFSVNEREANGGSLTIKVKLYSYWLEGEDDLYLGEVNVSVDELLVSNPIPPFTNGNVNKMKSMTCPIKVREESTKAMLSLSYRFKPAPADDLYPPQAPDYSPSIGQPLYPNQDPARPAQPLVFPAQSQTATKKLILELVIKFAKDIKNVNSFSAMDVYASVAILKDKKAKHRINTLIAFSGHKNPKWNHEIEFSLDEMLAREGRLTLLIYLMSHRPFLGDKEIGKVKLPIQELLSSNPPSPLAKFVKLETHDVMVPNGKKGTFSFTYNFLEKQASVSTAAPSSTTPQPYIVYLPASHQSYPIPGTSSSMAIQSGGNDGPSNGLVPIYMLPPHQSNGMQQYPPLQPQMQPQQSQLQPLPHQPPLDTQSQPYKSHPYQQYSSSLPLPEKKPQSPPSQKPTHLHEHTQGARPNIKPQGSGSAALGLGAAFMGRVIGGAIIHEMISDEVGLDGFGSL
ncbi:SRC2-like protein [Cardamine amara subsp. amara]|uniref:SRC2-like protein n=1 Tax=Cardamine amara subsp. amara TaxID=228776 RepID=A0ABD1BTL7_CARAN